MSQQINLFNPVFLKQKKYFSAVTMLQGLSLILGGSVALTLYVSIQLSTLTAEAEATGKQLRTAQTQLAKVTAEYGPKQKDPLLQRDIKETEASVAALQRVFDVLQKGEFGNTAGYSEYLRALSRQIDEGIWITSFSITGAGNEISLKGRALRPDMVPAYITRLKREPVLQGKSFAVLEMQSPDVASAIKNKLDSSSGYVDFSLNSSLSAKEDTNTAGGRGK